MASQQDYIEKMQLLQSYWNVWRTDPTGADPLYCCFPLFWYTCCAGYMLCSGRCGESQCPEICLCTETQHKIEMDKRDGKFGPQAVMSVPPMQQMSKIDQPVPAQVGYYPSQAHPPPGYLPPSRAQVYPPPSQAECYPPPADPSPPQVQGCPPPSYTTLWPTQAGGGKL